MAAESVFIYPGGREVPKGTTAPRPRPTCPPQSPSSGMMNYSSSLGLAPPTGAGGPPTSRPGSRPGAAGEPYEAEMGAGEPSRLLPVSAGQVRPPQTAEAVRRARENEARAAVASPGAMMTTGDVQSVLRQNKDKLGALQVGQPLLLKLPVRLPQSFSCAHCTTSHCPAGAGQPQRW